MMTRAAEAMPQTRLCPKCRGQMYIGKLQDLADQGTALSITRKYRGVSWVAGKGTIWGVMTRRAVEVVAYLCSHCGFLETYGAIPHATGGPVPDRAQVPTPQPTQARPSQSGEPAQSRRSAPPQQTPPQQTPPRQPSTEPTAVSIRCPHCTQLHTVPAGTTGVFKCPSCGAKLRLKQ